MSILDNPEDIIQVSNDPNAKPVDWETVKALHLDTDSQYLSNLERASTRDPNNGRLVKSPIGADWLYDDKGRLLPPERQTKVFFSRERVYSALETARNGEPTYLIKEFITIVPPKAFDGKAQKDYNTIHTLLTPFYEWRFKKEYDSWKAGKAVFTGTTPLIQWSGIQAYAALVDEMAQIGIKTVEDLATTSDFEGSKHVKNFKDWKEKAKAFVADKNKPQELVQVETKLAEQQKKHEAEITALTKQVEQLVSLIAKQQAEQSGNREKGPDGKFQKRNSAE